MIPDYLIYDQLKRERERDTEWQPEPLHAPLYVPDTHRDDTEVDEESDDSSRGVVIIDMNGSDANSGFDM
jgi:hypothetical protein